MYYYGRKSVSDWMNDNRRPKQPNQRSLHWLREVRQCEKEISRNLIILYFLITKMGENLNGLMGSEQKQRTLLWALRRELKKRGVEEKWERVFAYDIGSIHRRREYVFLIIKENLKLTEHHPYFKAVGYDRLIDFTVNYGEDADKNNAMLLEEIQKWEAEHSDVIASHMESIAEEKANMERHRKEVKEKAKAEKEARKLARKLENDEVKEIKENNKKYLSRKKRIDRSFERYWS